MPDQPLPSSRRPGRRRGVAGRGRARCGLLVLLLVLLIGLAPALAPSPSAGAASTPVATPAAITTEAAADVRPADRAAIWPTLAATMPAYTMAITLDPAAGTIGGTMTATYHNDSPDDLTAVYFRVFPNIAYYGAGGTTIGPITRADAVTGAVTGAATGAALTATLELADSALRVDLPTPLAPGDAVTLMVPFVTTVPADTTGSYGIFNYDSARATWILADWHPVLAVYEAGTGWVLDPPTDAGDPTHAAASLFDVTLTAPDWLTVAATGRVVSETTGDGLRTQRLIAGPAREFTLVADDSFQVTRRTVDGVEIALYTEAHVPPAVAETTLNITERALRSFSEAFGPYPFTTLDLVDTRLTSALAVSWAGLVFLDGEAMLDRMAVTDPVGFETIVAHELAHLWWGNMVGSNSNLHTYINEGLATMSSLLYLEAAAGPDAVASARDAWVLAPTRQLLARGDMIVDSPIQPGEDAVARSAASYGKSTLGFEAIRAAIGDDAFRAGLHEYATTYRFGIATPADLRAAFTAASGQDIDALWSHWFEQAALTEADLDAQP